MSPSLRSFREREVAHAQGVYASTWNEMGSMNRWSWTVKATAQFRLLPDDNRDRYMHY
jgi:hypothetical protein